MNVQIAGSWAELIQKGRRRPADDAGRGVRRRDHVQRAGPRARATMAALGLRFRSEDVGGTHGRTVRLNVARGNVMVSTVGGASYEL